MLSLLECTYESSILHPLIKSIRDWPESLCMYQARHRVTGWYVAPEYVVFTRTYNKIDFQPYMARIKNKSCFGFFEQTRSMYIFAYILIFEIKRQLFSDQPLPLWDRERRFIASGRVTVLSLLPFRYVERDLLLLWLVMHLWANVQIFNMIQFQCGKRTSSDAGRESLRIHI